MSLRHVFGRWNGIVFVCVGGAQLSMKLVDTGFSNQSNSTFWPQENKDAVTEKENQRCNASSHSTGRGAEKEPFSKNAGIKTTTTAVGDGGEREYVLTAWVKRPELRTGSASETC